MCPQTRSVLNVHLNLFLEVFVVLEALLQLKINKKTVVVIETKHLILATLVVLQLALEADGIATVHNVRGTAVNAVTVLRRHEGVNKDAVLLVADLL